MKREFGDYIEDIIKSMENSVEYVKDMRYDEFVKDIKTVDAVDRKIQIIGEASKKIPKEIKDKYPEIPWKDIMGMRDIVVHRYFDIKSEIIWITIKERIPPLIPIFKKILLEIDEKS